MLPIFVLGNTQLYVVQENTKIFPRKLIVCYINKIELKNKKKIIK